MSPDHLLPLALSPFVGSFLSVLAVRIPLGEPVIFGRSVCRTCGVVLGPLDLVPLASWMALRGRCRRCGAAIGGFYLVVELAAIMVAFWAAAVVPGHLIWASCALGWCLVALAAMDARHGILADVLTIPLMLAGLAAAAIWFPSAIPHHVVGAASGYGGFWLVARTYRALRGREGLGMGDAKLLAAAGAWVSWAGLPSVVLMGALSALGAVAGARLAGRLVGSSRQIPFGPFLCLGTWVVWLHGPIALS